MGLKDGVVAEGWEASVSTAHQVLRKADRIPILPDTQSKEAPGGMCHSWGLCQETQNEGVCAFSHVLIHSFPHFCSSADGRAVPYVGSVAGVGEASGSKITRSWRAGISPRVQHCFEDVGMNQTPERTNLVWRSRHGRKRCLSTPSVRLVRTRKVTVMPMQPCPPSIPSPLHLVKLKLSVKP